MPFCDICAASLTLFELPASQRTNKAPSRLVRTPFLLILIDYALPFLLIVDSTLAV